MQRRVASIAIGDPAQLPDDADPQKISSEFKDGVLRVRVQKHEHVQPKSVEIKVS